VKWVAWAALLCALPAQAYVRTKNDAGIPLAWVSHGHSFRIDSQGTPDAPNADVFNAIRKSFQTWADVKCTDLTFPEEALSTSAADRVVGYAQNGPNHNLVLFRTRACRVVVPAGDACRTDGDCGNKYDCWDEAHGDNVIATTTTTSSRSTGQILDSDIEMNDSPSSTGPGFTFTTVDSPPCVTPVDTGCVRIDVQNTVTHEAGHSLGLDHTPDPDATMYASAPSGETSKRTLAQDDINGICAIYPPAGGSGGCGCSHSQVGPGAVLGALLLLLHAARRSRRKPQLAIKASTDAATAARFQSGSEN